MSKEAMTLALEALNNTYSLRGDVIEAIKALEEALAKQEGQSNFCPNCEALSRELKAIKQEQGEPDKYVMDIECTKCGAKQSGILTVNTTPQPKQEQGEPVAWRYKPVREDNPRWEYTTQHPLDMGDGYLRPSLVEYCKCIEPLYATEKPKLMLEKFREMKDLLEDTVQHEPATKEQIREAIIFKLPLYTTPQPAQKPWVGLTDEELRQIWYDDAPVEGGTYVDKLRQVEAKLKEKNNG